jgi:hypothetical protein
MYIISRPFIKCSSRLTSSYVSRVILTDRKKLEINDVGMILVAYNGIPSIQHFVKIGHVVQNLRGRLTNRESKFISLAYFF